MDYWRKQTDKPLFPDLEWSKPEQRSQAGKLGIIGGNSLGFAGVAESYRVAMNAGVGYVRALLPSTLKKTIPAHITEVVFGDTNPSGSLSKKALPDMNTLGSWSQVTLLVGDAGRSSETAAVYEEFIMNVQGPLVMTRDSVDLVKNSPYTLVERDETMLVVSFAQLQKLFQSVYYPKVLTFSMQLSQLVEALHKFTITYPTTIAVLHKEHLVLAHGGEVVTTDWRNPMAIWRGDTATKMAAYWLWNPGKPLEAAATAALQ